jgi:hypothetical protein
MKYFVASEFNEILRFGKPWQDLRLESFIPYPKGTGVTCDGVKNAGHEVESTISSNGEVSNS